MRQIPTSNCHLTASSRKSGITLIELLVAITVIGLLAAIILPALQAAREAGRRVQCANNLKQLGLALQNYLQAAGSFPTSFWRTQDKAAGLPNPRPTDNTNRHSWLTMILPYVDQAPLYYSINVQVGVRGAPNHVLFPTGDANVFGLMNSTGLLTPVAIFMCPSDPSPTFSGIPRLDSGVGINGDSGPKLSYFGNLGDNHTEDGSRATLWPFQSEPTVRELGFGDHGTFTGIMCRDGGTTSLRDVIDGSSNTFAVGESLFESCDWFTWPNPNGTIASSVVPINYDNPDSSGDFRSCFGFRSNHPSLVQFLFCDGRVATIRDTIDRNVYRWLSTRAEGEVIEAY